MKFKTLLLTVTIAMGCFQTLSSKNYSDGDNTKANILKTFTIEEYQQDFNKMVNILLKNHPQPYEFISEDSLANLINQQFNKITDSTKFGRFLWICQPIVSAINCGHTNVWTNDLFSIPMSMLLPVDVEYVGSNLYVIDSKNNANNTSAGDEIIAINGVMVETIQNEIFKHLPSDGFNESSKYETTNDLFKYFCSIYLNFPSSYTVTINHDGLINQVNLQEAENFEWKKNYLDNCDNQLCFETNVETSTAILTIRSFSYYRKNFPIFQSFIDSCFNQLKEIHIENLIIDLRNNGGGDPFCGSYLVQHIANKPYTYFHKDIRGYGDLKKLIEPSKNAFKNKPYLLTNGLCLSTTGHVSSIVKENNFGVFIGDETGATYTCNDNSKVFTLKNTKLLLIVARGTYYTTASTLSKEHGIIPDHRVVPDIYSVLYNTDTVMNYTLKLIENE